MAKLVIANGTTANDGTGDTLRSAATKINSKQFKVNKRYIETLRIILL